MHFSQSLLKRAITESLNLYNLPQIFTEEKKSAHFRDFHPATTAYQDPSLQQLFFLSPLSLIRRGTSKIPFSARTLTRRVITHKLPEKKLLFSKSK